jgi:archaetidylinositol phosphate synthase
MALRPRERRLGRKMAGAEKHDLAAKHKRTNSTLLSFAERPALSWLCARLPSWVTPDLLTLTGLIGSFITGIGYLLLAKSPWFIWMASLGLALNWFGDSLDGSLARFRHIERPKYGFFIDHTVDVVAEFAILGGIALSGYVNPFLALLALLGYFMVSIFVYVYTFVSGEFRISYGGMGPTEMRVLGVICNALIFFVGKPMLELGFARVGLYDGVLAVMILALYIGYAVMVIVKAIELNRLEQKKA